MIISKRNIIYPKILIGVLIISIFLSGCGHQLTVSTISEKENNIERIIKKKANYLMESSEASSVQYALLDNGKIIASGNVSKNPEALTKDTIYGVGSVSKIFAASAVMKLVDEGKLDLETPVYKYIPDFYMKDERYKEITPRMLLNHSSGLRGTESTNDSLLDDNDSYVHDKLLETLSGQTLKAEPGAFSVYCNSGFTLTEILVERVSGMSFTDFLHENFMDPLQMKNSGTPKDSIDKSKFADYYMENGKKLPMVDYCNAIASGGIESTAEDMVKLGEVFMGKHIEILSKAALKSMESEEYKNGMWPGDVDDSSNYGLGWDSVKLYPFTEYGIQALAKGGDVSTYHASFIVLPEEKMAVAVLTSGGNSMDNQSLASKMLILALKDKGRIRTEKKEKSFGKPKLKNIPLELMNYSGTYAASDNQFKVKLKENGELVLTSEPDNTYLYTGDGKFLSSDGNSQMSFVKEKNGRVYLWKRSYSTDKEFVQNADSQYIGEKLEENKLSKQIKKIWEERDGKKYYILNNKYSSDSYIMDYPVIEIKGLNGEPGYWKDQMILDENRATSQIQIPNLEGRDTTDSRFYKKDGREYMQQSEFICMSENSITPLSIKLENNIQISSNGYAKWYQIPKKLADKKIEVQIPKNAAYIVYDIDGNCINDTYVSGKRITSLPKGGMIVFVGEVDSKFKFSIKE